jgi:hypothetical protein
MSQHDLTAQHAIFKFLKETSIIYNLCKKYSILIEEIHPDHKAPLHAANELKSLVFHLYHATNTQSDIDTNILEAKEHLCRAFYDLHSLLVSIYIKQIKTKLTIYKPDTIASVFPDYGNTIRPAIKDIQEALQLVRSNRNTDVSIINSNIDEFENQIQKLVRFDDIVEGMKPDMIAYEYNDGKSRVSSFLKITIVVIVTAIIAFGLGYYIANNKNDSASHGDANKSVQQTAK